MIKIFRNIRKSLLTEDLPARKVGKTIKYFKYAIGEIILVVIGILIAVQVNSWNTDNKDKKLEKRYITDLIQDLQADSVAIAEYRIISDEQVRKKNLWTIMMINLIQKTHWCTILIRNGRPYIISLQF
jgi:hypothetical protein